MTTRLHLGFLLIVLHYAINLFVSAAAAAAVSKLHHHKRRLELEATNPGDFPFFVQWGGCAATLIWEDILLSSAAVS
jgi:hypothetical protein